MAKRCAKPNGTLLQVKLMFAKYRFWVINVQAELSAARDDVGRRQAVFDKRRPEMEEMRPKLMATAQLLTQSASKLMKVVAGV